MVLAFAYLVEQLPLVLTNLPLTFALEKAVWKIRSRVVDYFACGLFLGGFFVCAGRRQRNTQKYTLSLIFYSFFLKRQCLTRYGGWMYNQNLYPWSFCLVRRCHAEAHPVKEQENGGRGKSKEEINKGVKRMKWQRCELGEGLSTDGFYLLNSLPLINRVLAMKTLTPSVFLLVFFPSSINIASHWGAGWL